MQPPKWTNEYSYNEQKQEVYKLKKKKLKQSTSRLTAFLVPFFQIISSLLLLAVTGYIGYVQYQQDKGKQMTELDQRRIEIAKSINDSLAIVRQLENTIQELKNERLINSYDSIQEKKETLLSEIGDYSAINDTLKNSNSLLKKDNSFFSDELQEQKLELEKLQADYHKSEEQSSNLSSELKFAFYKDKIDLLRQFPSLNYNHTQRIIDGIKNDTVFRKRILDSLARLGTIDSNGYWALAASIAYLGTSNHNIVDTLNKYIDVFIPSGDKVFYRYINLYDLLQNDKWSRNDRYLLCKTVINNLSTLEDTLAFRIELIDLIALAQDKFDLNLPQNDPNLYLVYMQDIKESYKHLDSSWKDQTLFKDMSIMCPQLAVSFTLNDGKDYYGKLKDLFTKKIKSLAPFQQPYTLSLYNNRFNYSILASNNIEDILNSLNGLDINKGRASNTLKNIYNLNKTHIDFWLYNDFNHSDYNIREIKSRWLKKIL